jgi:hypothetical protein
MHRKILAMCASLVALGAFAIAPSVASATTLKDTVNGVDTTLPVGAKIIADSTGVSKFNGGIAGNVECNENVMTGQVTLNKGNEVEATIEAAYFQSNLTTEGTKCKSSFAGPVTVTIPALTNAGGAGHWCIKTEKGTDNWVLWGNNCGTVVGSGSLTFILDIGTLVCKYEREKVNNLQSVTGTFTTDAGSHVAGTLKLSGTPVFPAEAGNPFGCPASGKLEEFDFDLYTDPDGSLVKGDSHVYGAQPTANPVYFKNEV